VCSIRGQTEQCGRCKGLNFSGQPAWAIYQQTIWLSLLCHLVISFFVMRSSIEFYLFKGIKNEKMKIRRVQMMVFLIVLASISAAKAQNVGVGTQNPINGNLVIKSSGLVSGLVVGDSTAGVSFGENNSPYIGFNTYFRGGRKLMQNGFGGYMNFNHVTGTLFFGSAAVTGLQGALPVLTSRLSINKDGDMGIGVNDALAGLHLKNKAILIDNASGFADIIMDPAYNSHGGGMELQNNAGIRTIVLRAADGTGQSGELVFYNPDDNTSTLELDGDYSNSGRSRIIVDELQIKGGSDFAEYFDVAATKNITPQAGMLVSIDANNAGKLRISESQYDRQVVGVISGANGIKTGMMMGQKGSIANGEYPVAITGRVYVRADASTAAILPGDLLTTSNLHGHAMKAICNKKSRGSIIGKAMTALEKGKTGMVLVILSLQ